jgi:hypothetical protein
LKEDLSAPRYPTSSPPTASSAGRSPLKLLQQRGFEPIHPAELTLPVVEGRLADPVFAAQVDRLRTQLVLPQNPNDLLFRKPLPLHRLALL